MNKSALQTEAWKVHWSVPCSLLRR